MQKDFENIKNKICEIVNHRLPVVKFSCGFLLMVILSFYAVYEFSLASALHQTDTVNLGESIVLESEGASMDSRIEGVEDIFRLSEELAALTDTHVEWTNIEKDKKQTGFFCIAEDKSTECVYNIDQNNICKKGYKLKDFDYLWVDSFSGSFYTVINISGRVVDLSDYYILVRDSSANLASRLIINCYEAEEVLLRRTIFTGTLVAPNAHVTYENTVVNGQIYATGSSGVRASYRDISFSGYYKMMSALKKADLKNDAVRKAAISYLKQQFPLLYADLPSDYIPGEAELLRVKELSFSGASFEDVTSDLQYFKKLQSFSCIDSTIGRVDFSGLKSLSKINITWSVVNDLKFGNLNSLLQLNVSGSITDTLDLSGCPSIVSLNYKGTPIKNLFLPEYSKIIYLNCADSGFKGFTEEQIKSLTGLLYLDAEKNKELGSIDLSVFPNLKKVNLSKCGLKELTFENCLSLYYAKCSGNEFTAIDLSSSPALLYFEAYSDVLVSVDATGLFKKGFAALYVYDEVEVIDNDPPPVPEEPVVTPGTETETPDTSETPDGSLLPDVSDNPDASASPSDPENTTDPETSETPGTVTPSPDSTETPETSSPAESEKPENTEAPAETEEPKETATSAPVETEKPQETENSEE